MAEANIAFDFAARFGVKKQSKDFRNKSQVEQPLPAARQMLFQFIQMVVALVALASPKRVPRSGAIAPPALMSVIALTKSAHRNRSFLVLNESRGLRDMKSPTMERQESILINSHPVWCRKGSWMFGERDPSSSQLCKSFDADYYVS